MNSKLFQMEYYNTYYFTNILHGLLTDSFPYLRVLDEFFGDLQYRKFLIDFPKYSALHLFIEFVIEQVTFESTDDVTVDALIHDKDYELWVNHALKHHEISHIGFKQWLESRNVSLNDISEEEIIEYHGFLSDEGSWQKLMEQMTEEVFFLMFMNRDFLRNFNEMIAFYISDVDMEGLPSAERAFFRKDGVLRRARIPTWTRRAVFYRDRGLCSDCHKDISGLVSIHGDKHFDHIVPLAKGGINDATNLQLLCEQCNLKKKHKNTNTSKFYERWYR